MKLSKAFSLLEDLRLSFVTCVGPAITAIIQSPLLIFQPRRLMRLMFFEVWRRFGTGADQGGSEVKANLITPHAKGIVLDIGAGLGHTAAYLDRNKVTKYIALEPNTLMHPALKYQAESHGFTEKEGTLQILTCGAEDYERILGEIGSQVDTLVSILTLCSIPRPQHTIKNLVEEVLKSGGELLFYEHVANKHRSVRMWQMFWSPIWMIFFDGCVLYRPSGVYVRNLKCWEPFPADPGDAEEKCMGTWEKSGEDEESLFPHLVGRLIKA